ncbi:MAG TPA: hypothetical protein VGK67_31435 [Myxococcales bacterium]
MPKPPPGGPAKPKPADLDVGETTRLPPLPEPNDTRVESPAEAADETVEVTNPMARIPVRGGGLSNDTRVDKPLSEREEPQPILVTDPSVGMTIPLPRIPEPAEREAEGVPLPRAPALPTKVEGLPGARSSSREQPARTPAEPNASPAASGGDDDLLQSKPVDLARRATVLKINPETIQSWLTEGPSGEHKAQAPGGFRPLIEDLKEELEAESRRPPPGEAKDKPEAPAKPGGMGRPSSERNPRTASPDDTAASAPPGSLGLRKPSSFRARAKRLSSTLSMLLKQEAARRRRGFLYGVLSVAFLGALGYFAYVYLWPLILPMIRR